MSLDFELELGTDVLLPSHNYPNYYPHHAYVLWTFQPGIGEDTFGLTYRISFGYVRINDHDYLKIGFGWDPDDVSALIVSYGDYYYGYPNDLDISATKFFIEFSASAYYESNGFRLVLSAFKNPLSGKQ